MTNKLAAIAAATLGLVLAGPAFACPGKIGATQSLTGSYSTFGSPISNAAQLAVEQIAGLTMPADRQVSLRPR